MEFRQDSYNVGGGNDDLFELLAETSLNNKDRNDGETKMEKTKFDELRQYLDIAKEYGVLLTPEVFNNAVNAVNKEDLSNVMNPYMDMMTKLIEECKDEKSKCDSDECNSEDCKCGLS